MMEALKSLAEKIGTTLMVKDAIITGSENVLKDMAVRGLITAILVMVTLYGLKMASEVYYRRKMLWNTIAILLMTYTYWMLLAK